MKTYIVIKTKSSIRRTYGGENYTLSIYEVKNKNTINFIGEKSACTSYHKGEISEAWSVVYDTLSKKKKAEIKRLNSLPENKNLNFRDYYSWSYTPKLLGIQLISLGF